MSLHNLSLTKHYKYTCICILLKLLILCTHVPMNGKQILHNRFLQSLYGYGIKSIFIY